MPTLAQFFKDIRLGRPIDESDIVALKSELNNRFIGLTALDWTVITGNLHVAYLLLKHGADKNLPRPGGTSAREIVNTPYKIDDPVGSCIHAQERVLNQIKAAKKRELMAELFKKHDQGLLNESLVKELISQSQAEDTNPPVENLPNPTITSSVRASISSASASASAGPVLTKEENDTLVKLYLLAQKRGLRLLNWAALEHPEYVPLVLKTKTDVNAVDGYAMSALVYAVTGDNADAVKCLLEAKADPKIGRDPHGKNPLQRALNAFRPNQLMIDLLTKASTEEPSAASATSSASASEQGSALYYTHLNSTLIGAILQDNEPHVTNLLRMKADPNAREGIFNAFQIASNTEHPNQAILRALVAAGATQAPLPEMGLGEGQRPTFVSMASQAHIYYEEVLTDTHDIGVMYDRLERFKLQDTNDSMHKAVAMTDIAYIKTLKAMDCSLENLDSQKRTPLARAVDMHNAKMVRCLLDLGAIKPPGLNGKIQALLASGEEQKGSIASASVVNNSSSANLVEPKPRRKR